MYLFQLQAKNGNFLIFELKKQVRAETKRSRAEPSRAENLSARAMARASSARAHHYLPGLQVACLTVNGQVY